MKIVCDSCNAKYKIADEKVAGKVFKIRCKTCSEVIVVRGDQVSDAPAAAAAGFDYGGDQAWHVVIDGDQQGPYTPEQLGAFITDGTIDWEAYVWKEGFDGWKPARDLPDLVAAITGQPQEQEQAAPAAAAHHSSAPPAAAASMGADPFASAGADAFAAPAATGFDANVATTTAEPAFGGAPADGGGLFGGGDAGADLFGQQQSSFGGGDDVVASAPSPRVSSQDASMTGERNENSVLFSLSNLQALATGSSAPSGNSAPAAASPAPGQASGEGSGLIDIRALAASTKAAPSAAPGSEKVDDLLSIGAGGPPLSAPLGAPMLAPVAAEPESESKTAMYLIAAVAAFALLALGGVIIFLLTREQDPVAATAAGTVTAAPVAGAVAGAAPVAPAAAAGEPAAPAPAAAATADEPKEESSGSSGSSSARKRRRRTGGGGGGGSSAAATPTPSAAPATMKKSSGGSGSIDDLLAGALGDGGKKAPKMAAAPSENLPDTPSRDSVRKALQGVSKKVSGCGKGKHGIANTTITFKGSTGRVSGARVTGPFAGTPVGSCVARAVRSAKVQRFKRSTFPVNFPFRI